MAYMNLKAEMARNKVSAKDIALCAEVSINTVYNWFRGGKPNIEQAKKIHDEFFPGCEFLYLFAR